MNINKVVLMGRLTADPELKISSSNVPVLRFTVAVNRRQFNKNDSEGTRATADFIDCVAFYKNAEFVSKYFKKGSCIIVFGSLQIETWKDKNGNNQRSARVVVDELQFGESRRDQTGPASALQKESEAFSNIQDSDFFTETEEVDISKEDDSDTLPF